MPLQLAVGEGEVRLGRPPVVQRDRQRVVEVIVSHAEIEDDDVRVVGHCDAFFGAVNRQVLAKGGDIGVFGIVGRTPAQPVRRATST